MSDMTMSDVLALQNRNSDAMGGGSSWLWWILLIFILAGNGSGFGGNSAGAQTLSNDFLFSNLNTSIDQNATRINAIGDGISSATYALNNTIAQMKYDNMVGQNAINSSIGNLGMQMQQNCCQLNYNMQTGFSGLQNAMQMGFQNIMQNDCNNTQRIVDLINQNTTQALRDELSSYKMEASNATQSAYLISQLKTST